MPYAPTHAVIATPIGKIRLWGTDDELHGVRIDTHSPDEEFIPTQGSVAEAAYALKQYFAGEPHNFNVNLRPASTNRGNELRAGIISVGYGETATYGALARRVDSGPRAVGSACRTNPFPIIVPCHRIVSADGRNQYYSGGEGAATKAWLLEHENGLCQRINALAFHAVPPSPALSFHPQPIKSLRGQGKPTIGDAQ